MADVIGNGRARTLVDVDGDAVTVTGGRLDVNAAGGDVSLLAGGSSGNLIVGTVKVESLDTTPATFDTVTSLKIDTADDTSWHRLHSNTASKEVQIQSLSTNVDIIYLGKYVDESSEVESIELVPAASISLPLSNLNLLSYKKPTHTTINQYLLVTVLTNA
tara:strand:+ start:1184 stop:1666 length:483 start_codon:yes stop_codon:yes gene_type:complete